MSLIDLNRCDQACLGCVKSYKKKHSLSQGKFEISCNGIPAEYISPDLAASLGEEQYMTALSVMDPVTWAAEHIDWHCLDPDGSVWKRKNPKEYENWVKKNPGVSILGKSRYHRPYQATMLRCTAKNKIFRIGRQSGKTETLVISMLYNMFTKPGKNENEGFKIILITPFQTQIELIFTRLTELISNSTELSNSISRSVKAPQYSIELHNKSMVKGFTAGTKSAGNADSVRGQSGDMLVFDEADYLSTGDLESALAIITNYPDATVWMSSTPTGKREKFYHTCHSKLYKEYHFPSHVNPLWSDDLEKRFRETYTDLAYKHEVLAEFGDQEEGVFQNSYVQAAKADYQYGSLPYNPMWTYTIGVDWNDTKNGTTIAVLGLNPSNNNFYVVDRAIVSKEGWTQLTACYKIAEFNKLWNPVSIYIDYGHGGTQWEVLRKFGYDATFDPQKGPNHPDARLKDILKQYNFGSKIETHDLFTKMPVEKSAKPFLVECTVRRFESQNIKFPKDDAKLEEQLLNYIIDRVSVSGVPIYKPGNEEKGDHLLDAVMLAVVAFTLEKTEFGKPTFTSTINFSGYFGQVIDAPKEEGSLVIDDPRTRDKNPSKNNKHALENKPSMNRTAVVDGKGGSILNPNTMPANNVSMPQQIKLWDWPGFGHDAPRPTGRTGFGRRGGNPPQRKKF